MNRKPRSKKKMTEFDEVKAYLMGEYDEEEEEDEE